MIDFFQTQTKYSFIIDQSIISNFNSKKKNSDYCDILIPKWSTIAILNGFFLSMNDIHKYLVMLQRKKSTTQRKREQIYLFIHQSRKIRLSFDFFHAIRNIVLEISSINFHFLKDLGSFLSELKKRIDFIHQYTELWLMIWTSYEQQKKNELMNYTKW